MNRDAMALKWRTPVGVCLAAGFFALAGLLETGAGLWQMPRPWAFWPVWETFGRGLLYLALAAGLWQRRALCRSIAMIYCLAALITYAVVLGLALAHAPVRFPTPIILGSLFQVPSCALLFPYLRSPRASVLFPRSLFGP